MEENLILEGLLSMVTELKEKQEAQVTPAGREETLSRLEAIERALSELRRNPAVPEKELQDILTRLAELRKSGQEQRQSFGEVKNYVVATFGCLKKYRYLLMQGQADGNTLERLENKFKWQRDERFIRNLTDSVLDFEERCRRQAEALERAKLLNEQAEQLKKEADRLGNQ